MTNHSDFLLFSGTSNPELAKEIAEYLDVQLGQVHIERFPDGEIFVQLLESVRGKDVYVIQSVALKPNHYLMELLIIIDALKRASAKSITAVLPYFGYCRQDRRDKPRVPITAKLVANLIANAGANHIVTMDLHAGQLQGFFDIPVDNISAKAVLAEAFKELNRSNCIVVTPDVGSIKLARNYANHLGLDFAIVDKHRLSAEQVAVVSVIGDVNGKDILLADDMCSTGSTLTSAAKACQEKGAKRIFALLTHGLFTKEAVRHIEESPIEVVFMSNTVPYTDRLSGTTKIRSVSVAPLFGQAIGRILSNESISSFT